MDKKIKNLLGNYQVVVVFIIIIFQGLLLAGTVEVAEGIKPLDAASVLVAVQLLLLTSHQLDTFQVSRGLVDALQKIDFKDNRFDAGVDIVDDVLTELEGSPTNG